MFHSKPLIFALIFCFLNLNDLLVVSYAGKQTILSTTVDGSLLCATDTSASFWALKLQKLVLTFGYGNTIATCLTIIITLLCVVAYNLGQLNGELGSDEKSNGRPSFEIDQSCHCFSLDEILSATQNFDSSLIIGRGGFGNVYRGLINDGANTVAVKRLNSESGQGTHEFKTELELLSKMRHSHIVSLIGYCDERQETILVYEYMSRGSLADHLYKKIYTNNNGEYSSLAWDIRLKICIGAARGADYLHTGTGILHRVIHRDLKSSNILLDENWAAKISDLGLSKVGPANQSCTDIITKVKGTPGFVDPEYKSTRKLTRKSDVYSFGVVLLEVFCGRPAVDYRLDREQQILTAWARQYIKEGKLDCIIDPSLKKGQLMSLKSSHVFIDIVSKCLYENSKRRPSMGNVVAKLEDAMNALMEDSIKSSSIDSEFLLNFGKTLDNDIQFLDLSLDEGPMKFAEVKHHNFEIRRTFSKGPQVGSFFSIAGTVVLKRAVKFLAGSGFRSNSASRKISILAFEFASTISKGSNLLQSLSEENINFLKKEILLSEGVQRLVSTDMTELLRIAAADKRAEFFVFFREVSRFGDLCKESQWHQLERYFCTSHGVHIWSGHKMSFGTDPPTHKYKHITKDAEMTMQELRALAEMTMQELRALAHHTSELYHELYDWDIYEKNYLRKRDEVESLHLPRRVAEERLLLYKTKLIHKRKAVRSLKKRSLWSKKFEEVVEKLVDVAFFIHLKFSEAFRDNDMILVGKGPCSELERLGVSNLALHYAHTITRIDKLASCPAAASDDKYELYKGLPICVKKALRSRLRTVNATEELSTSSKIAAEIEKTLQWLRPMALRTMGEHQGFEGFREVGNHSIKSNMVKQNKAIRLQTLHHADKHKTDQYILELVICLHRWFRQMRNEEDRYHNDLLLAVQEMEEGVVSAKIPLDRLMLHKTKSKTTPTRDMEMEQSKDTMLDKVDGLISDTAL